MKRVISESEETSQINKQMKIDIAKAIDERNLTERDKEYLQIKVDNIPKLKEKIKELTDFKDSSIRRQLNKTVNQQVQTELEVEEQECQTIPVEIKQNYTEVSSGSSEHSEEMDKVEDEDEYLIQIEKEKEKEEKREAKKKQIRFKSLVISLQNLKNMGPMIPEGIHNFEEEGSEQQLKKETSHFLKADQLITDVINEAKEISMQKRLVNLKVEILHIIKMSMIPDNQNEKTPSLANSPDKIDGNMNKSMRVSLKTDLENNKNSIRMAKNSSLLEFIKHTQAIATDNHFNNKQEPSIIDRPQTAMLQSAQSASFDFDFRTKTQFHQRKKSAVFRIKGVNERENESQIQEINEGKFKICV